MPTVDLKWFARQGSGRKDRQRGDYMFPPFGENKEQFQLLISLHLLHVPQSGQQT